MGEKKFIAKPSKLEFPKSNAYDFILVEKVFTGPYHSFAIASKN